MGTLNSAVVIGDVAVFQKEAQYAVLSKSSAEFSNNGATNLSLKERRVLTLFLRKADEPPQIHVTFNDKRGDGSDLWTALSLR